MARVRNWDAALVAWTETVVGQPFQWGRTDCVSLARGAVRAMTGEDPAPDLKPWKSARGLLSRVTAQGGPAAWLKRLAEPVGVRFVQSGDVVLLAEPCQSTQLPSLAVAVAGHLLLSPVGGQVHLQRFSRLPADTQVWRVG